MIDGIIIFRYFYKKTYHIPVEQPCCIDNHRKLVLLKIKDGYRKHKMYVLFQIVRVLVNSEFVVIFEAGTCLSVQKSTRNCNKLNLVRLYGGWVYGIKYINRNKYIRILPLLDRIGTQRIVYTPLVGLSSPASL